MKIHTRYKYAAVVIASALTLYGSVEAYAATQAVTASISFDTAITLTKNADINFGTVVATTADTYTIDTAGTVTAGGGAANILGGSPTVGDITIAGSTTQTVSILANISQHFSY